MYMCIFVRIYIYMCVCVYFRQCVVVVTTPGWGPDQLSAIFLGNTYTHTHRGTGEPTEEEIGSMLRCAHELREEGLDHSARAGSKRYGMFKGQGVK